MGAFVGEFGLYLAILLVGSIPLALLAWRDRLTKTMRSFAIGAVVIAAICGVIGFTSDEAVRSCIESTGSRSCNDPGSAGMQVLFAGGYLVVAWVRTFNLFND